MESSTISNTMAPSQHVALVSYTSDIPQHSIHWIDYNIGFRSGFWVSLFIGTALLFYSLVFWVLLFIAVESCFNGLRVLEFGFGDGASAFSRCLGTTRSIVTQYGLLGASICFEVRFWMAYHGLERGLRRLPTPHRYGPLNPSSVSVWGPIGCLKHGSLPLRGSPLLVSLGWAHAPHVYHMPTRQFAA